MRYRDAGPQRRFDPAVARSSRRHRDGDPRRCFRDPLLHVRATLDAEATARVRWGALVARELVWDVIGDAYAGTLRWDPEHVPLRRHVATEVKNRGGRDRPKAAMHTRGPGPERRDGPNGRPTPGSTPLCGTSIPPMCQRTLSDALRSARERQRPGERQRPASPKFGATCGIRGYVAGCGGTIETLTRQKDLQGGVIHGVFLPL